MTEGIDFTCCDAAMQEIQISQSHLYEFASETGLVFDPQSVMPISELWAKLEAYYLDTGVLKTEPTRNWEDPVRPGDPYVKGQNQVAARFISLYPQCKKISLGKNRFGIQGLAFKSAETSQQTESTFEPTQPVEPTFTDEENEQIEDAIGMVNSAAESGDSETIQQIFSVLASLPAELKKKAWERMSSQTQNVLKAAKPKRVELDKAGARR
ncbi:hypothetical protein [Leptolyngbya sp. FACHB-17]|uniref:hypothetical protein n=1 Tax=unclassified Leptolyngbya TaxID=2650499 RepID=UPI001680DC04|nr:hypothetical protein [Leptolyngbya sp. FACHB-17]MBD2082690.1 hypothetical protein [Leptolyngbya sp. FACHB-17]